jgi:hypothetical protein
MLVFPLSTRTAPPAGRFTRGAAARCAARPARDLQGLLLRLARHRRLAQPGARGLPQAAGKPS